MAGCTQVERSRSCSRAIASRFSQQAQAVFSAAGEHAVRLGHTAGNQVVDQHTEVGLVAARRPRLLALHLQRSVGTGQQALSGGLLITGCAIDLSGKEQPFYRFGFQRGVQAGRIKVIVLDGVAGTQDVAVLKSLHRAYQRQLDVERQACRNAVRINLVRRQPFWFEENVVTVLRRETVDLVFDRWAIARPNPLDDAGVHRRTVQSTADDLVRTFVGAGHPTRQLVRMLAGSTEEGKHRQRIVRMLFGHHREINGLAVETRRCSGLQPPGRQLQLAQARGKRHRRHVAHAPAGRLRKPHVNFPVEKGSRREHHGTRRETDTVLCHRTDDPVTFDDQIVASLGKQREVWLIFQAGPDGLAIQHAICLRPRGAYCRSLTGVQDAELDTGLIGGRGHRPVERIDLLDQMPLADSADRGVATHRAERVEIVREQQGFRAHARTGQRRFGAGMAATDHDYIERVRILHEDEEIPE